MALKKSKSCKRKVCRQSKQRGGQASSCIVQPNLSKYLNSACYQANLHNTNPEAGDLALAQGAGFLPGLAGGAQTSPTKQKQHEKQTGGQCSAPGKPVTFAEYKAEVKKYLGVIDQFGGKHGKRKLSKRSKTQKKKQAGGTYFSINPEEMIGGLPRVDKGDSCCHGAVLGGKFVQGDSGRAICGNQIGAGAKPVEQHGAGNTPAHMKQHGAGNTPAHMKQHGAGNTPVHMKQHGAGNTPVHMKQHGAGKKTKKRSQKKQRGGSEPASFPDAFANENSNFSPDASDKDFSCRQPFWGPKCR